jgi:photosystem II stability/assembly factor-like uncharacterized protein
MRIASWSRLLLLFGVLPIASCRDVTLPREDVQGVEITGVPTEPMLVGSTVTLHATALSRWGRPLAGREVVWSSNDTTVVKVNASGVVTAMSAGSATITAMIEGRSGSASLSVVAGPTISFSATEVEFSAAMDEQDPMARSVEITNTGGGTLAGLTVEIEYAAGQAQGWLTAELSGTAAPAVLTLRVDSEGHPPGELTAVVKVHSPADEKGPRLLPVHLQIQPPWTGSLAWERLEGRWMEGGVRSLWDTGQQLLATGEGGWVMRSSDGGVSWSMLSQPIPQLSIPDGRPVGNAVWGEGAILIATGGHTGSGPQWFKRSTDGGATWTNVYGGSNQTSGLWGAGSVVIRVGQFGIGRSMDGGLTWSTALDGVNLAAAWGEGSTVVAVGAGGSLYRSTDLGVTWSGVASGTGGGLFAVWGRDGVWLAAGASGTLLRSADDGASWAPVASGTVQTIRGVRGDGTAILAFGDEGTIVRSTNGGQSWSPVQSGTTQHLFTGWGTGAAWVAGGQAGTVLRSTNGGVGWMSASRGPGVSLKAVWGYGMRIAAVGANGTIRHSANGGSSWQAAVSGTGHELTDVWGDGDTFVAVGAAGTIIRSTNGGTTWSAIASPTTAALMAVQGAGGIMIAVGSGGTIIRSTDQGTTWSLVNSGTAENLTGLSVRGAMATVVGAWWTLLRSDDGGATWTPWAEGGRPMHDLWIAPFSVLSFSQMNTNTTVWGLILKYSEETKIWSEVATAWSELFRRFGGLRTTLFATGTNGTLFRSVDGGSDWQALASGADHHLTGVWVGSGRNVFVVGSGGVILRGSP